MADDIDFDGSDGAAERPAEDPPQAHRHPDGVRIFRDLAGGSASGGTRTHTVVRGDTLWALASTYLGSGSRYKEIMRLNGLTSEIIHVGQVLKMPAK